MYLSLSLSLSICTYLSRAGPHDQNASATATLSDSTPRDTPAQGGVRASVRGNVRPSVGGSVRGSLVGKGARPKGRASTMAKQGVNKAAGKLLDARQSWVGEISRRGGCLMSGKGSSQGFPWCYRYGINLAQPVFWALKYYSVGRESSRTKEKGVEGLLASSGEEANEVP